MPSKKCITFIINSASQFKYMYRSQIEGFANYVARYYPDEVFVDVVSFIESYVFDEEVINE